MASVRVMFIGQGPSGLAEDRVVNTFHFHNEAPSITLAEETACGERVIDFYNGTGSGAQVQSHSLGWYLSPWVARAAEVRTYNLADLKTRVPVIMPMTLEAGSIGNGMPEEVAVCLSFRGLPPRTPRRRGRIYFGPLAMAGVALASMTDCARPSGALTADLCTAAARLSSTSVGLMEWSIRSTRPTENFVRIFEGYVDNALDTQIRRGPDTTARTMFAGVGI